MDIIWWAVLKGEDSLQGAIRETKEEVGELMEYINGYKVEKSLYTKDGKEISVLRLEVENEESILDEWATHFGEQYRYLDDLDFERNGTGRTRQEQLRDYVFPSDSESPSPSTRVGDFCEILVADYIEFIQKKNLLLRI